MQFRLRTYDVGLTKPTHFSRATRLGYFPPLTTNYSSPTTPKYDQTQKDSLQIDASLVQYCHRGIAVLMSTNGTKTCLCPPNYFGNQCQWQNQRVSLTLQFIWRSTAPATVIFQAAIMLIDEYGQIAPNSDHIIYIPFLVIVILNIISIYFIPIDRNIPRRIILFVLICSIKPA